MGAILLGKGTAKLQLSQRVFYRMLTNKSSVAGVSFHMKYIG